ncbi:MAG: HIT domain-containing protein [Candidatus Kariarchaeaceae archaeon]|jgi:diadenosine tetraphosphate (Ap4A) HIT family hydrolase
MDCSACELIETGSSKLGKKIMETDTIIGVLMTDRGASPGHCLFMPKEHIDKMHNVSDEILAELVQAVKTAAKSLEFENYNVLQNNGAAAFQTLFHVHFHYIPKTGEDEGLRYMRDSDLHRKFDNTGLDTKLIAAFGAE